MRFKRLGYSKLSFSDYFEHSDYWLEQGVHLPAWASDLDSMGYKSVDAISFYEDLFMDYLEEHKNPEEYTQGEYGAIACEQNIRRKDGKEHIWTRRITITQDLDSLIELIDRGSGFCFMSAASYAGRRRLSSLARELYALVIEVDSPTKDALKRILELFPVRRRKRIPKPTYIVCSGTGLHLYFCFEKPIQLWPQAITQLTKVKRAMVELLWDSSTSRVKAQEEPVLQAFRIVGTKTKSGNSVAMAFRTGNKISIEELNSCLATIPSLNVPGKEPVRLEVKLRSELSRAQAKAKYPGWYQRVVVEGQPKGHFYRHPGIYNAWKERIINEAAPGHRYFCLENLAALAVQCQIPEDQLKADLEEVARAFQEDEELLSEEDLKTHGHFSDSEVIAAMQTYRNPGPSTFCRKRAFVEKRTGISLPAAKRSAKRGNQAEHIKVMNFIRTEILAPNDPSKLGGRPIQAYTVSLWREKNPGGRKCDCVRETGLSKPTVYKWWDWSSSSLE